MAKILQARQVEANFLQSLTKRATDHTHIIFRGEPPTCRSKEQQETFVTNGNRMKTEMLAVNDTEAWTQNPADSKVGLPVEPTTGR